MIENKQFCIQRSEFSDPRSLSETIAKTCGPHVLRWYIAQATESELVVEATVFDEGLTHLYDPSERRHYPGKHVVLNVVPTGVGCNLGGYAGDAAPSTNLLALTADYLITNPNAVNASDFIGEKLCGSRRCHPGFEEGHLSGEHFQTPQDFSVRRRCPRSETQIPDRRSGDDYPGTLANGFSTSP